MASNFFQEYIGVVTLGVTSLQNVAHDGFWQSDVQNNATNEYEDAQVTVRVVTTTTAGSANGFITIYGYASIDGGTQYTAGASGSQGPYTNTAQRIEVAPLVTFPIKADETTARTFDCGPFALSEFWTRLPERYGVIIKNSTGAALATSGNTSKVQPIHGRSA